MRDSSNTKPYTLTPNPLLKIGQAANLLGVSIDTLRRWEKAGKISAIRTPGGTRLYSLESLQKINPVASVAYIASVDKSDLATSDHSLSTENLLKETQHHSTPLKHKHIESSNVHSASSNTGNFLLSLINGVNKLFSKLVITSLVGGTIVTAITIGLTAWLTSSYLTHPGETKQFLQNNIASKLLAPFEKLSQEAVSVIDPEKAYELGFLKLEEVGSVANLNGVEEAIAQSIERNPIASLRISNSNVLAVTSASSFLEINDETQINGNLNVRDNINNLNIEATPSASTFFLTTGGTTLTVTKTANLDQDVSTGSKPVFSGLNLSSTKDQLVFQSGGPTGTLTWTPTNSAKVITLPDATTTLVGQDTTDTLSNKTMSGSSNTFTNLPNSAFTNPSLTVTAGTNLTGGGTVALGATITLALKDSPSITGTLTVAGGTILSSTLAVTGATTLSSTLAVTGASTFASTINTNTFTATALTFSGNSPIISSGDNKIYLSGGVGVGQNYTGYSPPSNGLLVEGNVGISTSAPQGALDVLGAGFFRGGLNLTTGNLNLNSTSGQVNLALNSATNAFTVNNLFGIDTLNNRVGIGTTAPTSATFAVSGNATIGSDWLTTQTSPTNGLLVQGNVGIGSTFTSTYTLSVGGNIGVSGHVLPTGASMNIGSSGLRWSTGYFDTIDATSIAGVISGGSTNSSDWTINADNATADTETMSLAFERGTTTPNAVLRWDVSTKLFNLNSGLLIGSTSQDSQITDNSYGLTFANIAYDITTGTNEHLSLMPNGTGNVGIGTTGPLVKLEITGGDAELLRLNSTNSTGSPKFAFHQAGAERAFFQYQDSDDSFDINTDSHIDFLPNNTQAMRIDSTGNIGLGTESPTNKFQVSGGNVGIGVSTSLSTLGVNGNSTIGWGITGVAGPSSGLAVSGNLGVGTTTADYNLSVIGTGNFTGNVGIGQSLTVSSASLLDSLQVTKSISGATLGISGASALTGNVGIGSSLTVTSASVLDSLQVTKSISGATLGISGGSNLQALTATDINSATLTTTGNVGIGSSLTVTSAGVFSSGIKVSGAADLTTLYTTGASYLGSTLNVTGASTFGGQILASDGTASLPGYSFSGDTNTGIFRPSTDALGFTTGGTSRLTVTAGGNVGIGFTSPQALFTVGTSGQFQVNSTGGITTSDDLAVNGGDLTSTATTFNLLSSNVTTLNFGDAATTLNLAGGSTSTGCTVNSSGDMTCTGSISGSSSGVAGYFARTGTLTYLFNQGDNVGIGTSAQYGTAKTFIQGAGTGTNITLQTTGSNLTQGLTVLDNGNVGVGTTNPGNKFEVVGGDINILTSGKWLKISASDTGVDFSNGTTIKRVSSDGHMQLNSQNNIFEFTGNLGIGATTSSNKLDVWGNGRITGTLGVDSTGTFGNGLFGYSGVTAPSSGLAISGNVGVGTTSPIQALHVVGQCVTGDTKLKRRRRKRRHSGESETTDRILTEEEMLSLRSSMTDDESGWEEVRIDQINPGDEILTLDEKNGKFIPSQVKGLMDMGIKDIYQLKTESGKSIKTTKEHPYLVRTNELVLGRRLFEESNIHQKNYDEHQSISNSSFNNEIIKIQHSYIPLFLNMKANDKDIIDNPIQVVNKTIFEALSLSEEKGVAIANATHPAAKLTNNSDDIVQNIESTLIKQTLSQPAEWIKVSQIKVGMEVATIDGWEVIKTINHLGREQVWDIEVENTHNFVGNDIVAHNTYISGNVGIGATTSSNKLDVWGNARITGTLTVDGAFSNNGNITAGGLFLASNGSASAPSHSFTNSTSTGLWSPSANALSLTTNGSGTSGITITAAGNVGIGITSPGYALDVVGTIRTAATNVGRLDFGIDGYNSIYRFDGVTKGTGGNQLRIDAYNTISFGTSQSGGQQTERMRLDSTGSLNIGYAGNAASGLLSVNGNVGIGTSAPGYRLDIQAANAFDALVITPTTTTNTSSMRFANAGDNFYVGLDNSAGTQFGVSAYSANFYIGGAHGMNFFTSATNRMTIASGGNVGIGTASPTSKFLVSGGNVGIGVSTAISTLAVNGNSTIGWGITGVAGPSNGLAVLGNVGIGTTTADYALDVIGVINSSRNSTTGLPITEGAYRYKLTDVGGTTNDTGLGIYAPSSGNNVLWLNLGGTGNKHDFATISGGSGETFRITQAGNIGIGNSNPGTMLSISGNSTIGFGGATSIAGPSDGLAVFGNVGIGTTSTSYKLDVVGNTRVTGALTLTDTAGNHTLTRTGSITGNYSLIVGAGGASNQFGLYDNVGGRYAWYTNSSDVVLFPNGINVTAGSSTFAGQILASDGTASLPGYSFSGDTNTGIFRAGTDALDFVTGGTERLTITAGGNVGIGDTTPEAKLGIGNAGLDMTGTITFGTNTEGINIVSSSGTTGYGNGLWFQNGGLPAGIGSARVNSADWATDLRFYTHQAATTNQLVLLERMRIDSEGNVGIGTTAPGKNLEVYGAAAAIKVNVTSGNPRLYLSGADAVINPDNGKDLYFNEAGETTGYKFRGSGTSYFTGNLGIGATTSSNKLDVWGNARITGTLTVDGSQTYSGSPTFSGQILASDGTASLPGYSFSADTNTGIFRPSTDALGFTTGGTSRLTITAGGNVGIGTTAPTANLQIGSTDIGTFNGIAVGAAANRDIRVGQDSTHSIIMAWKYNATAGNAYSVLENYGGSNPLALQSSGGNVGIGTASPDALLELESTAGTASVPRLSLNGSYTSGETTFGNVADIDFKIVGTSVGRIGLHERTADAYALDFSTLSGTLTTKMSILGNGNVGIGTTNPGNRLSILTDSNVEIQGTTGADLNIYSGASANLFLGSNAANVTINSSGNVGFQTTSPAAPIHLLGDSTTTGVQFLTQNSTKTNFGLSVLDNGNVGIGATNPQGKFEIFNSTNAGSSTPLLSIRSDFATAGDYGMIRFGDQSQTTLYQKGAIIYEGVAGSARGRFHLALENTDGTGSVDLSHARFTVLSDGNVGIGTTGPGFKLDTNLGAVANNTTSFGYNVFGDATSNIGYAGYNLQLNNDSVNSTGYIRLARTSGTAFLGLEIGSQSTNGIRFLTGAVTPAEYMRIDNNGNVGIGFTSPTANLHVVNTAAQNSFRVDDVANDASPFVVNADGNVGVGNPSPSASLHLGSTGVNNSTALMMFSSCNSTCGGNRTWQIGNSNDLSGVNQFSFRIQDTAATSPGLWMQYDSNNVGIGVSTPYAKTHISSNISNIGPISTSTVAQLKISNPVNVTGNYSLIKFSFPDNDTNAFIGARLASSGDGSTNLVFAGRSGGSILGETMTLTGAGNLGIGTTGPRGKLEIPSNTAGSVIFGTPNDITVGTVDIGSAANGTPLSLTDGNNAHIYFDFGSFGAKMRSDSDLVLGTANVTAMTLKGTSGNVGIGFTSPVGKLVVSSGNTYLGTNFANSKTTQGLTINQGANDDEILSLKSSDINQDQTSITEADTFALFKKYNATAGGLEITAPVVTGTTTPGIRLYTFVGGDTTKTATSVGAIQLWAAGYGAAGGGGGQFADNGNLLVIGHNATNKFIFDEDGEMFAHGTLYPGNLTTLQTTNYISGTTTGIGIGTVSPAQLLHVAGSTTDTSAFIFASNSDNTNAIGLGSGRSGDNVARLMFEDSSTRLDISTVSNITSPSINTNIMSLLPGGNVGIGWTSPSSKLHLWDTGTNGVDKNLLTLTLNRTDVNSNGYERAGILFQQNNNGGPGNMESAARIYSQVDNASPNGSYNLGFQTKGLNEGLIDRLYIDGSSGYVGIGTTGPTNQLHVYGTGQTTGNITDSGNRGSMLFLEDTNSAANSGGAVVFGANGDSFAAIKGGYQSSTGTGLGDIIFSTRNNTSSTALTEMMRLDYNGNLGIGATTSSNKLDVWGNARITGTLTLDGAFSNNGNITAGGVFLASNGSASAPSHSFTNLTNAGLWTNGDGLLLTTGGSNTSGITVTGAGYVGIGTTSPAHTFQVGSAGSNKYAAGSTPMASFWGASDTTADKGGMFIISSSDTAAAGEGGSIGFAGVYVGTTSIDYGAIAGRNQNGAGATAGYLQFSTRIGSGSMTEAARIDSRQSLNIGYAGQSATGVLSVNGNVGIGTSAPNYKLDVNGEIAIRGAEAADDARMYIQASDNSNRFTIETDLDGTTTNDVLGFRSSSADNILVLKGDGNVGIGTASPDALLELESTTSTASVPRLSLNGTYSTGETTFGNVADIDIKIAGTSISRIGTHERTADSYTLDFSTLGGGLGLTTKMSILGNGNVGIGTTGPQAKLDLYQRADASVAYPLRLFNPGDGSTGIGTGVGIDFHLRTDGYTYGYGGRIEVFGQLDNPNMWYPYMDFKLSKLAGGGVGEAYTPLTVMRINNDGNVGIGTTGPSAPLTIAKSSATFVEGLRLDNTGLTAAEQGIYTSYFYGSTEMGRVGGVHGPGGSANGNLVFYTNNAGSVAERMRITNVGNVGIGMSAPDRLLQISSNISSTQTIAGLLGTGGSQFAITGATSGTTANQKLAIGVNTTNNFAFLQSGNIGTGATNPLILNGAGGNIGIGITSPKYTLDVSGTLNVTTSATAANTATGGTITYTDSGGLNPVSSPAYAGGYTVHTFTTSGTFTPATAMNVDALVVAGGGGGGEAALGYSGGGGGGAGGMQAVTAQAVTAQAYTITVGAGGSGANGSNGNPSSLGSLVESTGGGGGGSNSATRNPGNGGSGGGAAYDSPNDPGGTGIVGQGKDGGSANGSPNGSGGGGGGGASAVGAIGNGGFSVGGNGGDGSSSSLSGAAVTYAGGGGGGYYNGTGAGTGGSGGGGGGGTPGGTVGTAGTANTGGGGGGGTANGSTGANGGTGGSGIVIIRYLTNQTKINGLIVNSSGNVGIGFTSPDRSFQLSGDIDIVNSNAFLMGLAGTQFSITGSSAANLQKKLVFGLDVSDNYGVIQVGNTSGTNYNLVLNPSGGNVGIGTTSPTAPLEVKGSGTGATIAKFSDVNNTGCTLSGGGLIACSSDIRLKKNIGELSYGLDTLMQLHPVFYNWKSETDETVRSLGFIAQEVELLIPKLVTTDSDTGFKQLNTIGMVPILTKSIQELNYKVASSEAKLSLINIDSEGGLVVPKLTTDKLLLTNDVTLSGSEGYTGLLAYEFAPTDTIDSNNGTSYGVASVNVLASLKNLDESLISLRSQVATSSADIAGIQSEIASSSSRLSQIENEQRTATSDLAQQLASASAVILETAQQLIGSSSAELASQKDSIASLQNDITKLNLTPPETLFATGSAQIANLTTSEATISGMLASYDLKVSNALTSLGTTTLANTLIAGDLNIDGTLAIENGSELNVMGTLYLQKSIFAQYIDLFDGKVIVDSVGNIATIGAITATEIKTNKLTISNTSVTLGTGTPIASGSATLGASIGSAILPAGQTSLTINTTAVSSTSKIFITPTTQTDKVLSASNIINGVSFTVSITSPSLSNIRFNWWIVETE